MALTEGEFQLFRAGGFALALVLAISAQRLAPHARLTGSWRVNVALWGINGAALSAVCGGCACSVARWAASNSVGVLHATAAPDWVALPTAVVALDLVSYAWHRANHRLATLWRFHRVHHSDLSFTVSTGLRFHPGELLLSLPLRLVAIAALGAPVGGVLLFEVAFTFANLLEHSDVNFPLTAERGISRVFITPALHRFHHTRRRPEMDSNFGTVFSLWDRLFATFRHSSSALRVDTGAPGLEQPLSLSRALSLPFL